ncbi:MAG: OPT family oligopeptide transporter [Bacteriovoracia bacterium]
MKEHKPFIPDSKVIPELTPVPLIVGTLLGIVFGASSLYLALKVGMTVSASIPVAVLSVTLFRAFSSAFGLRRATILENNIAQTAGSAGESIAFGVAVTMPALMILGYDLDLNRTMLVAILGGLLGILMMIPLRHALIVKGRNELTYPEGTACAEVLIVGEKGGTSAKTVFTGFGVGLLYKTLNVGCRLWNDVPERIIGFFRGAAVSCEVSPELMGVGYIIGPKIGAVMVAGGVLSSWVLIPMIRLFGDKLTSPIFPATKLISEMSIHEIWRNYVLYIGAGAVAAGGLISLLQSLPTIIRSAAEGISGFKTARKGKKSHSLRTERDISMNWVLLGAIALIIAITMAPDVKINFIGAVLILIFGFLFVTVSARLTGEIGSSSNPISGMTVATLLFTSLIFLLFGWTTPEDRLTALSVAAIVSVACSNGGTTAQDLKTGYIVGATPKYQQIAILAGAAVSALAIGYSLKVLNDASTIYSKNVPHVKIDKDLLAEPQKVGGYEGQHDTKTYRVFQLVEPPATGPLSELQKGKYLADDDGVIQYFVDPGINGVLDKRDDGSSVPKYEAPKARLMSLIIDGVLTQKLPWGLVLLGVAIALTLELCGVSSLPFVVGVYLPFSSSAPIFVGGMIRWFVDRLVKKKDPEENSDGSPGVLFSSGLIAGGSIAGILIAILSVNPSFGAALDFSGMVSFLAAQNLIAVIMFALLGFVVFMVGTKRWLKHKR